MVDPNCVHLLQECLPQLGLQWPGFRKVRRLVCKRVRRRMRALSLTDYGDYRRYLHATPDEWGRLAEMCLIPISRFYRDKRVFDELGQRLLPALAKDVQGRDEPRLSAWSAGCASGEEAYTVAILWVLGSAPHFPDVSFHLMATDAEPHMIARARRGCYGKSSLRDVPQNWIQEAFIQDGEEFCVRARFRDAVRFGVADILGDPPDEKFDLILCRNLAFTYFSPIRQREALAVLSDRLRPGGILVIGTHEKLPFSDEEFGQLGKLPIYKKRAVPLHGHQDRILSGSRRVQQSGGKELSTLSAISPSE
jgi:chemotaxis protein methyltransferase CheR